MSVDDMRARGIAREAGFEHLWLLEGDVAAARQRLGAHAASSR